jgi:hypothetical protein
MRASYGRDSDALLIYLGKADYAEEMGPFIVLSVVLSFLVT